MSLEKETVIVSRLIEGKKMKKTIVEIKKFSIFYFYVLFWQFFG